MQNKSTTALQTKPETDRTKYGEVVKCRSVSLYDGEPVTLSQAVIEATAIAEIFNIRNDFKVKAMAEVFVEDGWTVKRIKDAVKHVLKTNVYNTAEKGLEPGVILGFDKRRKLYTQGEVMKINDGTGTHGFTLIEVEDLERLTPNGLKTCFWYVKEGGYE